MSHTTLCRWALGLLLIVPACKSWSPDAYSLYNATRVPPPGTGTYQLPNGYYNNAAGGQTPPVNAAPPANSAASTLPSPKGGGMTSTNLASGNTSTANVQTAQFTQPTSGSTESSFAPMSGAATSPPFSGTPAQLAMPISPAPASDLQWQQ